jgi:hypothetical protein
MGQAPFLVSPIAWPQLRPAISIQGEGKEITEDSTKTGVERKSQSGTGGRSRDKHSIGAFLG